MIERKLDKKTAVTMIVFPGITRDGKFSMEEPVFFPRN